MAETPDDVWLPARERGGDRDQSRARLPPLGN